jgi:hypothetical protein
MPAQHDTLSIRMECTSPWRSALLAALMRLARGHGWEVTVHRRDGFDAVLRRCG